MNQSHFSSKELSDRKLVRKALIEALNYNDMDGFRDALVAYYRTTSSDTQFRDPIDPQKPYNPSLVTIGKIFAELGA